jgi:predicted nucleic acid-binding protein
MANEIAKKNVKPKDALHLACAIEAQCDYFITTDSKLLNKSFDQIVVVDPMTFIRIMEDLQ